MSEATIWKFPIAVFDEFMVSMPRDAEVVFVGVQNDEPFLWARVVPGRALEQRRFLLRGTGHGVDLDCKHLGSFMLNGGALVFHLFDPLPEQRART